MLFFEWNLICYVFSLFFDKIIYLLPCLKFRCTQHFNRSPFSFHVYFMVFIYAWCISLGIFWKALRLTARYYKQVHSILQSAILLMESIWINVIKSKLWKQEMAYQEACKNICRGSSPKIRSWKQYWFSFSFLWKITFIIHNVPVLLTDRLYCSLKLSTFLRLQVVLNYFVSLSLSVEFNHICNLS